MLMGKVMLVQTRQVVTPERHKSLQQTQRGFSLVELMVAMTVGTIILIGVFSLHFATRKVQRANEMQMDLVADSRFAIDLISYDLRHAGMWGGTNKGGLIECRIGDASCPLNVPVASNDCSGSRYNNLDQPVFGTDGASVTRYSSSCIPASESLKANTDILEVRYADSNPVVAGNMLENMIYVRSNFLSGRLFLSNNGQPKISAYDSSNLTNNFRLQSFVYYVSDYTDTAGDGIPSLRRVALVPGPAMQSQTLISGVVDFQVQYGEDTIKDSQERVNVYVNGDAVQDWSQVYSAKIWLVLRSDKKQKGINTQKTFSVAGANVTYGGQDDYRYFVVTSVVDLRNIK